MHNSTTICKLLTLVLLNKSNSFISKELKVTRSCVRYNKLKYQTFLENLKANFAGIGQLEESTVLRTVQCQFESDYQHHNSVSIPYKKPDLHSLTIAVSGSYNLSEAMRKLSLDPENTNHRRKFYKELVATIS